MNPTRVTSMISSINGYKRPHSIYSREMSKLFYVKLEGQIEASSQDEATDKLYKLMEKNFTMGRISALEPLEEVEE